MYINAHEHLNHYPSILDGLAPNQIILANTMDLKDFFNTLPLRLKYKHLFVGCGIHPWCVDNNTSLKGIEKAVQQADFIGEVGLDYLWAKDPAYYPKQRKVFEYFVQLSKKHHKLLNIHTKEAELDVLNQLKKYQSTHPIIHWYSGSLNLVDDFLALDAYFIISVDVGYSKVTNQLIDQLLLDRLLTEIDGPQSLEWVNHTLGSPAYIPHIVEYIAKRKELPFEVVKEALYQNMLTLLNHYHLLDPLKYLD